MDPLIFQTKDQPTKMELYSHQIDAIERMHNGCILNGGVGSGKSRTSLVYFWTKVLDGELSINGSGTFKKPTKTIDIYIITTARKRDTKEWESEMVPFLLSTKREECCIDISVVIDSWNNIQKYTRVNNAFFIFDEQRAVGKGAWAKSFITIARYNKWIMLSATPGDTWMDYAPVFIANGYFKNRTEFIKRHVVYSRFAKYPKVDRYLDNGYLLKLRNKILVNMDFSRQTIPHYIDIFTGYDRDLYKTTISTRWNPYSNEPIQQMSELCYVLRRIVNSDESRIKAVIDILKEHPKAIIFYNFDYELETLRGAMDIYTPTPYAEWNGHHHMPIPKGDRWVYLVQYTAGAEGWNCIETDTLIFYSQSYSYKLTKQAAGRIDRLNTPYIDLYYYPLRSTSSIDISIHKALKGKKNFNESSFKY